MNDNRTADLEVFIITVNRIFDFVTGGTINRHRHGSVRLFSVHFRDGEPVRHDGIGLLHPRAVLDAASAAWRDHGTDHA